MCVYICMHLLPCAHERMYCQGMGGKPELDQDKGNKTSFTKVSLVHGSNNLSAFQSKLLH